MTDRIYKTTKSPFAKKSDENSINTPKNSLNIEESAKSASGIPSTTKEKKRFFNPSDEPIEKIYILQPITEENQSFSKDLLQEASALVESAGACVAGSSSQKLRVANPATVFGTGKLQEIEELLHGLEITVLYNGDLSPSQTQNISSALGGRKVIDRTTLILDIFARNAKTAEGKLQVELAQLRYLYPRLKGKGGNLSRLGGGVGTRGPGETKLETDRRYIRTRIDYLEKRLEELQSRRELQTLRRKKTKIKTVALVGYTNAGKSTLFNRLCAENVYAENRLFATLDTTARKFSVNGAEFLLMDTVGFLRDLPHHLIDAFKSTLESALNCDLALIVCDGENDCRMQINTTNEVLRSLNFSSQSIVVVNKSDALSQDEKNALFGNVFGKDCLLISAKTGDGIAELKDKIYEIFKKNTTECRLVVPYVQFKAYSAAKNKRTDAICERSVNYTDDGAEILADVENGYLEDFSPWIKSVGSTARAHTLKK